MEGVITPYRRCLSSAILLVIGSGYLWYGRRYPMETLENPGPGVFPFAAGLLLVVLAALQLVQAGGHLFRDSRTDTTRPDGPQSPDRERAAHAPWWMVGVLVVYLLLLRWIGFLTCTFFLVVICAKLMGRRGWVPALSLAGAVIVACYVLFSVWLKVPLPTGSLM